MALFEGKQNVHLYVRFLAKLGAPLSSELLTTLAELSHPKNKLTAIPGQDMILLMVKQN